MSASFLRQEKGLLIVPKHIQKYRVSWTIDNIICGFKNFFEQNQRWPVAVDMRFCPYLPNVKTLERKFGGIKRVRLIMGLEKVDYRIGETRSEIAKVIGQRGFQVEEDLYKILINRFHEPFVHCQSREVIEKIRLNLDFVIYHKSGKFAVDVFYPDSDYYRFAGNLSMKYSTYKKFPYILFLVVANVDIEERNIEKYLDSEKRKNFNSKLITLTYKSFLNQINFFRPLDDPYSH